MPVSNSVLSWTLTMPVGSLQVWNFGFTNPGSGTPYSFSGITAWSFICRSTATDTTPGGLFEITELTTTPGNIVVTTTASLSQVALTINPAATASLTPTETFAALWSNPSTATAFCWLSGPLILQATAQP